MKRERNTPVVLTIAGSDSGGGAGIQADLKTFDALNVFGASAITCLTAQNPRQINAILPVKAEMVRRQIETVCDCFHVSAVKTGMLYSEKIVSTVADTIKRLKFPVVVVDPVCRATSGKMLLTRQAFKTLCSKLLPLATVITPNIPEAETLLQQRIIDFNGQCAAAAELSRRFKTACVIKGGHLAGNEAVDVLCRNNRFYTFKFRRLNIKNLHGTGCVFSAALAAYLARGMGIENAAMLAKKFVRRTIRSRL